MIRRYIDRIKKKICGVRTLEFLVEIKMILKGNSTTIILVC